MKKILIIIAVVAVFVAAVVIYWPQDKEPEAVPEETENYITILDEKEGAACYNGYSYNADSAEFTIYPSNRENFEFGYFEARDNGETIYMSEPLYAVMGFFAFETKDGKYFVFSDYSGGAHCCFEEYIFFLKDGDLKLIKDLYTGNANIMSESLILKDNNIYIRVFDDRFAYFYTAYAGSYFFPQHLKLDNDKLEVDNSAFAEEYIEKAEDCAGEIENMAEEDSFDFQSYSPELVCVAANYMVAGQGDMAWSKVEDYFTKIPLEYNNSTVEFETFKNEFVELYNKEPFLK